MKEPRDFTRGVNAFANVGGAGDRFSGYAVIGMPFSSGHVLALRRFEACSLGAAYTSVWHRDPDGRWTFHQDVPPLQSCPRYFGAIISENTTEPIHIDWTGPREFTVVVDAPGEIVWHVRVASTFGTRALNAAACIVPESWWTKPTVLSAMQMAAKWMLGTGELKLTGRTPNGQAFMANPRVIWSIAESHATIRGIDVGTPAPLPSQASLGDFRIPQRGIFAVANAVVQGTGSTALTLDSFA